MAKRKELRIKRMVPQLRQITVSRRSSDIHACITGQPGYWGCGKNTYEAVGNLVVSHPEMFRVKVNS